MLWRHFWRHVSNIHSLHSVPSHIFSRDLDVCAMATLWNLVRSTFWSKWFWLPEAYTWDDFKNVDNGIYHPQISDLLVPIPLAILLCVIRIVFERWELWFYVTSAVPVVSLWSINVFFSKRIIFFLHFLFILLFIYLTLFYYFYQNLFY